MPCISDTLLYSCKNTSRIKEVKFMKKGQTAAMLAVILVAAVGAFVLIKGTSVTGMVPQAPPQIQPIIDQSGLGYTNNPFCNRQCTRPQDCVGSCGQCSPYSGTCVSPATYRKQSAEAERILKQYQICIRGCTGEYTECQNRNPSHPPSECYGQLRECENGCRLEFYPVEE